MSNFFTEILDDMDKVEQEFLGPDYPYYNYIATPSELGMSADGSLSATATDVAGLINYVEFLVEGTHDLASLKKVTKTPYLTESQYENGVNFVLNDWVLTRRILIYNRHSDVDPKRKWYDPGDGFPWLRFLVDIGVTI